VSFCWFIFVFIIENARSKKQNCTEKLTDQFFLYVLYPRYSLWNGRGQKRAVTYSPFPSHEKLFQLPSTRVIVSKCERWKQMLETPATA